MFGGSSRFRSPETPAGGDCSGAAASALALNSTMAKKQFVIERRFMFDTLASWNSRSISLIFASNQSGARTCTHYKVRRNVRRFPADLARTPLECDPSLHPFRAPNFALFPMAKVGNFS